MRDYNPNPNYNPNCNPMNFNSINQYYVPEYLPPANDYQEMNDTEQERQFQKMKQLSLRKQQQILDYKDATDIFMSLLSTAEVVALQNSEEKELGHYDEYDTANRKTFNSQIIQFLRFLRDFDGARNDYEKQYKEEYKYPNKITNEYITGKINYFISKVEGKGELKNYFIEIINIMNHQKTIDIEKELKKYYKKKNNTKKEEVQINRFSNLMGINHLVKKEEKQTIDEYVRTGKSEYVVKFNEKPGRYSKTIDRKNKNEEYNEFSNK